MLAYVVDFPLRQRKHRNDVHASGKGLRGFWQGRITRSAGQDVPAGPKIPVEFSLDGIQQLRNVLIFVDQDGLVRFDEPGRIGSYCRSCGQVIAVNHPSTQAPGQLAEQGALAHRARSVEDNHRLFSKPCFHDLPEPSARQAGQYSAHAPNLSGIVP